MNDPTQPMILCVCQYGHSRSVALARAFHRRGANAIACGVSTSGPWLSPLCDAATVICLLDDALRGAVPEKYRGKIVSFHVGPDRWVNPYHAELAAILDALIDRNAATLSHITGAMKGGGA